MQGKIAAAQAQIDAIMKKTGLKKLQARQDKLLKNELWDYLEQFKKEFKKDDIRVVQLKNLLMRVNRFQTAPATYNYKKVVDYIMTQVNQDVQQKILVELKAVEKIGKTKANISFKQTEGVGDVWTDVKDFFSRLFPALENKGEKIDNDLEKAEQAISKLEG